MRYLKLFEDQDYFLKQQYYKRITPSEYRDIEYQNALNKDEMSFLNDFMIENKMKPSTNIKYERVYQVILNNHSNGASKSVYVTKVVLLLISFHLHSFVKIINVIN